MFELDALGGEMARNADFTGIQFRVLNTSEGPAVRANRVQNDKHAYAARMRHILEATPLLDIVEGETARLVVESGRVCGVELLDQTRIRCDAVVLTPGTFLGGRIHVGLDQEPGGRGAKPLPTIDVSLVDLGFRMARLKTGTPARLRARVVSITTA